jgi:hypothetical protein
LKRAVLPGPPFFYSFVVIASACAPATGAFFYRHSRESGNPFQASARADEWIPAFAGMTAKKNYTATLGCDPPRNHNPPSNDLKTLQIQIFI